MWSTTGGADNANGATARLSSSAAPNGRGKNRKGASSSSAHQTGDYHFYTDWFSLGLILHECWTGNLSVDLDALGYAPNEGEDPERADPEKACDEAHLKLLSQELPNISKDLEKIAPGLSILVSDAKNRTKRVVEDVDGGKIQWGKEYVAIVRRQKKNHLALENLQSEETKLLHQLEGIRSKRRKILDEMEG
ncbi:unnamed protein product [Amoebophrya sp. A25]|nr:unnamed protein product [Amoebophrya sp. A25]|eukprot:GSA25T00023261001.1